MFHRVVCILSVIAYCICTKTDILPFSFFTQVILQGMLTLAWTFTEPGMLETAQPEWDWRTKTKHAVSMTEAKEAHHSADKAEHKQDNQK